MPLKSNILSHVVGAQQTQQTATNGSQLTTDARRTVPVYSESAIFSYVPVGILDAANGKYGWLLWLAVIAVLGAAIWYITVKMK